MKLTHDFIKTLLPKRQNDSYKGDFGHSVIIGGNQEMAGAAILASKACVYIGSGLTTVLTHPQNQMTLHISNPEAMVGDWHLPNFLKNSIKKASGILIGPGMGRSEKNLEILEKVLQLADEEQVIVVDADAIALWSNLENKNSKAKLIFTPHKGEADILLRASGMSKMRDFAKKYQTIVIQKCHQSLIWNNQGESYLNIKGNPGMSIGGMGDCLAGMVVGLVGQVDHPLQAAILASYLHSFIANEIYQDQFLVLPSRLIESIPETMKSIFE
ncbi:NAD(P)H-hydrate dehydratase [Facklamia sp. DSM 111018]|uniref:ADP-dependent (S)-NAD(P)H-hydrate dehydratase n=1 Tax=Facklamia lactis TaxID=2749967 RepID=A0ABS0LPX4_9LACT|nr:NAD(P)H-hydrate dehydratase [Facklamia lactis]MBG9986123.1 NAD(P)H-hydrate dehydratase [Facklamia lactis]